MDPLSLRVAPELLAERTADIARVAMAGSHFVRSPNFTVIAPADLSRMFDPYDRAFFDGFLRRTVADKAHGRLGFRLAPRMTRAGGKTFRTRRPVGRGPWRRSRRATRSRSPRACCSPTSTTPPAR